ncbi:S-adenosylmethionine:tRNA ribosyltransferase-isomerase [Scopulibacillus darangshiensis]|uniref:S-adenosylmethionine:tRNA ribosyltransferase-isomerase n=1 Tax=Scopulibacillus darangshiensis TaxID=442528 RepID=A0A4R2NHX8_9BACL|nr:S-adenosylmethionine:tRNA ribosyltransferase-isomerase [Scopulibacillus darangshiensis]TCP21053.1 S-adenosylmethionine:tRNA ribosyltransferase-isomerase [Scopulibacillus darangshiensis]
METELIDFHLPAELEAAKPAERRGLRRDHVNLMVLDRETGDTVDDIFFHLDRYLNPGDLIVLNNSRTIPAVLHAQKAGVANRVEIRLAQRKDSSRWEALIRDSSVNVGDHYVFSNSLKAEVIDTDPEKPLATLKFSKEGTPLLNDIYELGEPVRYEYILEPWGLDNYQTVFASVPGSVEMPSAGRAFTWELLNKLKDKGAGIAYLQLHTGLTYMLDDKWHQHPSENLEYYEIPAATAKAVNETKRRGGKVIAVGTTVVRALETVASKFGYLKADKGWSDLFIHKDFPLQISDGLVTGFHEPKTTHLALLSAFIDSDKLTKSYQRAIQKGYLWHEFGDINLIL